MNAINEETLNLQIRKFLKKVGITSQREIERAIRAAVESGKITAGDEIAASMHLAIDALDVSVRIDDKIKLD